VKLSSFCPWQPGRPAEDQPSQNDDVALQSLLDHVLPKFTP
jgi:hypothetical protein